MQVMYVLIYLDTSLMKLDVSMIQRLQLIVEVILHDSVFPLMQFYFRAAKD